MNIGLESTLENETIGNMRSLHEKHRNPILLVQDENHYSVVGKIDTWRSLPTQRYRKYRDKQGTFIVAQRGKRVYEDMWNRDISESQ